MTITVRIFQGEIRSRRYVLAESGVATGFFAVSGEIYDRNNNE